MKTYDYYAATYDGDVYCLNCLVESIHDPAVHPIFANSEWDSYPSCTVCGKEIDYVVLIEGGG